MIKLFSTNKKATDANLKEAVVNGLAPDGGLYFPYEIPKLDKKVLDNLKNLSLPEIGVEVARPFLKGLASDQEVDHIVHDSINFPVEFTTLNDGTHSMELYHGPTLAFKDVGARFMSRLLGHFVKNQDKEYHVLVATSGDTGGAVASGFHNVEGIRVTILFPKDKVSPLQEKQLTTFGGNVQAIEVDGVFDDCQALVKAAFNDVELKSRLNLTSANSINIARLLPQSFYYFLCDRFRESDEELVISIPSGNFGNLTAGLMAWKMGLPVAKFVAATNDNNVVPSFLKTGEFKPKPSVQTYSNAMDVGNPSNFPRMLELFNHDLDEMRKMIVGGSLTDKQTIASMIWCREENDYLCDPHGAIAWDVLKTVLKPKQQGVFLETAHPAKFSEVVFEAFAEDVPLPKALAEIKDKKGNAKSCGNNLEELISLIE